VCVFLFMHGLVFLGVFVHVFYTDPCGQTQVCLNRKDRVTSSTSRSRHKTLVHILENGRERERESLFAISVKRHTIRYTHKFKQWQAARKVTYHHSWPPMITMNND